MYVCKESVSSTGDVQQHHVGVICTRFYLNLSRNMDSKRQKVKAIPLQAWTGPEDSRRLRLPDFKTIGTLRW